MSYKSEFMPDDAYAYYQQHAYREDAALQSLREATNKVEGARIQTSPEQGQALYLFLKMLGAKSVLEIGMFTGYGSLWMAKALPQDGYLATLDVYDKHLELAKKHWQQAGVEKIIEFKMGLASGILTEMIQAQHPAFDFIYIDADKASYFDYYEKSLSLLRVGGIIAIDNVLAFGDHVYKPGGGEAIQIIRKFNQFIHQDQRVEMVMLPIGCGLTLARKV